MTKSQIKEIINTELGYGWNKIIKLDKVSSIYSILDANFYPATTTRFKFTNDDLLLIYNGEEVLDIDGNAIDFINDEGKLIYTDSTAKPNYILPFSTIGGFLMVGGTRPSEPFRVGVAL